MLAGNVAALLSPCIFIPILTYAFGVDDYDWVSMREIRRGDDDLKVVTTDPEILAESPAAVSPDEEAENEARYIRAGKIAAYMTVAMTLVLLVLWPMPLYGTGYIFS